MKSFENTYGEGQPTYYVWGEGTEMPTRTHSSRYKAEKEAERLAQLHPDRLFHVLKLKRSLRLTPTEPLFDRVVRESEAVRAQRDKQMDARRGMSGGLEVQVSRSHHEPQFAGQFGTITRLGEDDDTSVYVRMHGTQGEVRFSPTSLTLVGDSDQMQARKRRPDSPLGGLFTRLLIDLAIDALSDREEQAPGGNSAKPQTADTEDDDLLRHMQTTRNMPAGTPVNVLVIPPMGPIPGGVIPGTIVGPHADPQCVYVDMKQGGKLTREAVNASRVYALDDPHVCVVGLD